MIDIVRKKPAKCSGMGWSFSSAVVLTQHTQMTFGTA